MKSKTKTLHLQIAYITIIFHFDLVNGGFVNSNCDFGRKQKHYGPHRCVPNFLMWLGKTGVCRPNSSFRFFIFVQCFLVFYIYAYIKFFKCIFEGLIFISNLLNAQSVSTKVLLATRCFWAQIKICFHICSRPSSCGRGMPTWP